MALEASWWRDHLGFMDGITDDFLPTALINDDGTVWCVGSRDYGAEAALLDRLHWSHGNVIFGDGL